MRFCAWVNWVHHLRRPAFVGGGPSEGIVGTAGGLCLGSGIGRVVLRDWWVLDRKLRGKMRRRVASADHDEWGCFITVTSG